MDPDNVFFETAAKEFQEGVVQLEEKMTSIIGSALNDATTPLNAYRVILSLGSFLERPATMKKVKESYPKIVGLALKEQSECRDMLHSLPAPGDADSVVSCVRQIQQIIRRARSHVTAIANIGIESDVPGMRSLEERSQRLEEVAQVKITQNVQLWTTHMNRITIHRPLFVLEESNGRLRSGADRLMARMVCECRQLHLMLDPEAVPAAWDNWSNMYDSLKNKMKLVDIVVSSCSSVESSITTSTRILVEPRLKQLKKEAIEPSQNGTWSWNSEEPGATEDLRKLAESTMRLNHFMQKLSSTVESIQQISSNLSKAPIVEFQEGLLPTGEQLAELLAKKYAEYSATSKKISMIVGEVQQLMPDSHWSAYLWMIDRLILEEILKAISNTYIYFIEQGRRGYFYELQLNITTEGY